MKLLVADDDPLFRLLLLRKATECGYDCTAVGDGEAALNCLRDSDGPRLAILDWIMPGIDGLEVCRRVRAARLSSYVYIILLTARTEPDDLLSALSAGADDFLTKPVRLEQLKLRLIAGCRIVESEARHLASRLQTELLLDRVRNLSQHLLHQQDEERRYVALRLHDNLAQILSGLMMTLRGIQTSRQIAVPPTDLLSNTIAVTADCVRDLRGISNMLHPPLLEEIGLPSALRNYLDGISQDAGLEIVFDIPAAFGRLPRHLEVALFRIAQEAISNVQRHSRSARAIIRLRRTGSSIELQIRDEGCGFSTDLLDSFHSQRGLGIPAMKERAEQCGGHMEIDTTPRGTAVTVTCPDDPDPSRITAENDCASPSMAQEGL